MRVVRLVESCSEKVTVTLKTEVSEKWVDLRYITEVESLTVIDGFEG